MKKTMNKNDAFKADYYFGNLDEAVKELINARESNINCYIIFNGKKLYSVDVTLDGAYIAVCGMSKEESSQKQEKERLEYEKKIDEYESDKPILSKQYKAKGREFLPDEKLSSWDNYVDARVSDIYQGEDIQSAIDLIEILNDQQPLDLVERVMENQNHSGASYMMVAKAVLYFADRGPEFFKFIEVNLLLTNPEWKAAVEKVEANNAEIKAKSLLTN